MPIEDKIMHVSTPIHNDNWIKKMIDDNDIRKWYIPNYYKDGEMEECK